MFEAGRDWADKVRRGMFAGRRRGFEGGILEIVELLYSSSIAVGGVDSENLLILPTYVGTPAVPSKGFLERRV